VADITYVETAEGWLYVAGVLDRCTRRCVGWAMGDTLATTLPLAALDRALKQRRPTGGLVHHSDRGVQYASGAYRQRLALAGVIPSMSRRGNCYDNAAMESFWSSLKRELVYRCQFATRAEARAAIFEWIEVFYNRVRLHSALGYKSPVDFETNPSSLGSCHVQPALFQKPSRTRKSSSLNLIPSTRSHHHRTPRC
jgi:transposase InsO family protein